MVEEQAGLRKEDIREWAPWTRIFTAFKVAMDPKKLLLAAAGILCMAFGWWLLAQVFFQLRPNPPIWDADYYSKFKTSEDKIDKETKEIAWKAYKQDLNSWNLLYQLAGPVPSSLDKAQKFTVEDFVNGPDEFDKVKAEVTRIEHEIGKRLRKVQVIVSKDLGTQYFKVDDNVVILFDTLKPDDVKAILERNEVIAQELYEAYNPTTGKIKIRDFELALSEDAVKREQWKNFDNYIRSAPTLAEIEKAALESKDVNATDTKKAVEYIRIRQEKFKPSGWMSTWPWFEDRGPNPYLLVTGATAQTATKEKATVFGQSGVAGWFWHYQLPVLMEPLYKFLSPVVYLFHPAATGWNRVYLILVIVWTLATWAIFGGAITRMAAVQVARPNEKVGLIESLKFTWTRKQSYFAAPFLPLVLLAVMTFLLFLFGLLVSWTFFVGDIVIATLGFPIALLIGLVMAVVLVGLIGWPLMYSTISAEGSDSFDAISRSYSYVYQAPWQYLWYCFLALVYGAALIFFVGLMGSLTIYLAKWGTSLAPTMGWRDLTYLYSVAPTSFGWRDLLLYQSPGVNTVEVVNSLGERTLAYQYIETMDWGKAIGAFFVSVWMFLLFLFIVGFGYSYFWSASAIIYLLMRRKVDDTDMDEIHLEEDVEAPYAPPSAPAGATPAPGGGTSLTMVEAPTMRQPTTSITPTPPPAATPVSSPVATPAPEPSGEDGQENLSPTPEPERPGTDGQENSSPAPEPEAKEEEQTGP
jgi:hypothetical protein